MDNNKDEAATSEATTGGGGAQSRNPIFNDNPNPNTNPNSPRTTRGKSCRGCTYYTSVHKAKSKNPTCIGFSKTLQQVPPYGVGNTELKASKEGRSLANFKYACIGYSVYLDNKDSSAVSQDKTAKLPFCAGVEVVIEDNSATSTAGHVPAQAPQTEEHEHAAPQPQRNKPPNITADQFFNRFQKNAILVANRCFKNLSILGSIAKDTVQDMFFRRPK